MKETFRLISRRGEFRESAAGILAKGPIGLPDDKESRCSLP